MSDVIEDIQYNESKRPKYTRYEIAKLVREQRESLGMTCIDVSIQFGGSEMIWLSIENSTRSFNVRLYRLISSFLNISIEELISYDVENIEKTSYPLNPKINEAIQVANYIFDEMVMQEKISV